MLVAIIGELDVTGGLGGVVDLLELEAAGRLHQISSHFSYQILVRWRKISVLFWKLFMITKLTVSGN